MHASENVCSPSNDKRTTTVFTSFCLVGSIMPQNKSEFGCIRGASDAYGHKIPSPSSCKTLEGVDQHNNGRNHIAHFVNAHGHNKYELNNCGHMHATSNHLVLPAPSFLCAYILVYFLL